MYYQYIRVGFPTDGSEEKKKSIVNTLCELLLNNWKMSRPNLIITVIGGTGSIQASPVQKKRFRHRFCSIIRIAMKTGEKTLQICTIYMYCSFLFEHMEVSIVN